MIVTAFSWGQFAAVAPVSFTVGLFCGLLLSTRWRLERRNHKGEHDERSGT
jgi:hypothetical protein